MASRADTESARVTVRRSDERGLTDTDWLEGRHSFSIGDYQDPRHMGLGSLRVLNEDRIAPGRGFGLHPHRNVEIVTYVLEGALAHRDSMGTEGVVRAGEAQFMRAGRGVVHSEMNASDEEPLHLLQVWFLPRNLGRDPTYAEQKVRFPDGGSWATVASPDAGGLPIDSDARMLAARIPEGGRAAYALDSDREAYVLVVEGEVELGGERLGPGDAATVQARAVDLSAAAESHVVLFDVVRG